ncbi:MAG TPA: NADH-quinone oxidoreductase subunit C [Candidatus Omnitrophota bacterium]|nr:NADH-quinone oxidoreductase subunit C [Candidatus Omnitrophota bacterium]HOX09479.1 NADH-quinone oxidoreductase subunit C [Candidatus Omnitrophota bacterium]HRZ66990.1 NADH-quinone oxidoreductase subunit C [Candidatus Omnitrophota bacterium]
MERKNEIYTDVEAGRFTQECLSLHKRLDSPVMAYFAEDLRKESGVFRVCCVFLDRKAGRWEIVRTGIPGDDPKMPSLAGEMYSASMFEREMAEMFGISFEGSPDSRRLVLHDEVWPAGYYPLRKDFAPPAQGQKTGGERGERSEYRFKKVEGEGIFEVPVGPVHAGIIGPGHFRFSAAGEPIINLETRLGFTHRGVEKMLEGMDARDAVSLAEKVAGDSAFAYSCAFCGSIERIYGIKVPGRAKIIRALFLELERIYNHANDIGGIATDVGFSFPNALASVIKEGLLALNGKLTGSRYLKGVNRIGGVASDISAEGKVLLLKSLDTAQKDFSELRELLHSSISFMDRVDNTGILKKKTAADLGITGLAARASGIRSDLRSVFDGDIYDACGFKPVTEEDGDVLARLDVRLNEFDASVWLIKKLAAMLGGLSEPPETEIKWEPKEGSSIGCVEAWRGPLLFWIRTRHDGRIERCKIVDPSFRNWQGLCFAVLGNIIPDFPLCNKSFDLSYPGNDL